MNSAATTESSSPYRLIDGNQYLVHAPSFGYSERYSRYIAENDCLVTITLELNGDWMCDVLLSRAGRRFMARGTTILLAMRHMDDVLESHAIAFRLL